MTFVYPLLLGGLLLTALPVLLHFLFRKKPTTLVFPAFRFLLQQQRSNTRRLRMRHLLLLLLRMAILALLCLALARPRLFHEALGISREKPAAIVLVFDTSPSMEYQHDETTRLDLARKRALELLDQLPADCRLLILDTTEPAAREEFHRSPEKARQRVSNLAIGHRTVPITRRIDDAMQRLDQFDEADLPRIVCVFGDRTTPSWDRSAVKPSTTIKTYFFDVGLDQPIDVAIIRGELPRLPQGGMRQAFAEGESITLHAAVRATGRDHEGTLVCKVAGQELRQAFQAKASEQQTVTFDIDTEKRALRPGYHQATLQLETGDAAAFNDTRYVTFLVRDRARVLVLADDVQKASRLPAALQALLHKVEVRTAGAPGVIDHDAVFLDGVAAPSEKLWQTLAAYVEKGGGVAIAPAGDALEPAAYNSDVAQRVMPAKIIRKVTPEDGAAWDPGADELLHPFLLPYGAWLEEGTSDFLRYPRSAAHYWEAKPTPGRGTPIVHYQPGRHPALIERAGKGKVVLLTTPLEEQKPEWTNYHATNTSFYVALTWLCARYLIDAPTDVNLNYRFGAESPVVKAPLVAAAKYVLTGPDTKEEIRFDERGVWTGDRLLRAGNYSLAADESRVLAQFSVNLPGEESDWSRTPVSEIEALLGKDCVVPQDRRTSLVDSLHWDEPVELFPWLMLAILLLLAMENLLANRFYRSDSP